jgi:hypothetical protein
MNLTRMLVNLVYAVLLLGCACFARYQLFGLMFGIGESGTPIGPIIGTFLIGTMFGAVGLLIAALGSWTQWPALSILALGCSLGVLPATILFCWNNGLRTPIVDILAPVFDLTAFIWSWLRFRQFAAKRSDQ